MNILLRVQPVIIGKLLPEESQMTINLIVQGVFEPDIPACICLTGCG